MAIRFVIEGDLRFISHHDTMRLFERALSRARLPVSFSKGFNPRVRLSLPLPRSVGMASRDELLIIELTEQMSPEIVLDRLSEQMPNGLKLVDVSPIATRRPPQPARVDYEVDLSPDFHETVSNGMQRFHAAKTWEIEREEHGSRPARIIDLKAAVVNLSLRDGILRWTIQVKPGVSPRPAEILSAVGLNPQDWLHRVCRVAVSWDGLVIGQPTETARPESPA